MEPTDRTEHARDQAREQARDQATLFLVRVAATLDRMADAHDRIAAAIEEIAQGRGMRTERAPAAPDEMNQPGAPAAGESARPDGSDPNALLAELMRQIDLAAAESADPTG